MSKKPLYIIIIVLIITNVVSLVYGNKEDKTKDDILDDVGDEELVENKDDQVAVISGKEISYEEWMRSLRHAHGKEHLKDMINKSVVKQLAEQKNIVISDKVIDREIAYLTTMSGIMNEGNIAKQEEQWSEELLYRYQLEALLTEDIRVTEEEARAHYEKYKNQYDFSTSFQLSHMTVKNMETAEKVIDELEQGASFNLLAKEYSLDDDSRDDGGYLGYFTKGSQFVPYGYEAIVENMDEHSYSEPISLGNEVAIIYLHRYLPEITFTFDELASHIALELAYSQLDQNESVESLWEELEVDWLYKEE